MMREIAYNHANFWARLQLHNSDTAVELERFK